MYDAALQCSDRCLRTIANMEPVENNAYVPFDRRLADPQSVANLLISVALDDQFQHFEFTRTQFGMRRSLRKTP